MVINDTATVASATIAAIVTKVAIVAIFSATIIVKKVGLATRYTQLINKVPRINVLIYKKTFVLMYICTKRRSF
jgi:hypothetical protein